MTLSQWSKARVHKDIEASLQTYQVGAHFEALNEPVLMAPSDSRYTQVVFNLISVQVCSHENALMRSFKISPNLICLYTRVGCIAQTLKIPKSTIISGCSQPKWTIWAKEIKIWTIGPWARVIPTSRGGSLVSGGPLGVFFGWKLKIYVKIIYFEHFVFLGKFWLLMIFGTLLSKKCPFLGNFDQNQFLPH